MGAIEEYGFPFASIELEDGIGDRPATDEDWARYVSSMFTNGYVQTPEGAKNGFEPLKVTAQSGMTVSIGKGIILIEGRMRIFSQNTLLTLDQADAQPRIDLICLRLNLNAEERKICPVVIKGTPSSTTPQPSYIRDDIIYDIILAKVLVPANVAKLTQNDITDTRRDTGYCGCSITIDASELKPLINSAQSKADGAFSLANTASNSAVTANTMAAAAQLTANNAWTLAAGMTSIVSGTYTGNGTSNYLQSMEVKLGFKPKAVFVMNNEGKTFELVPNGNNTLYYYHGGLAVPGGDLVCPYYQTGPSGYIPAPMLEITENGFRVSSFYSGGYSGYNSNLNSGIKYYVAFK